MIVGRFVLMTYLSLSTNQMFLWDERIYKERKLMTFGKLFSTYFHKFSKLREKLIAYMKIIYNKQFI
jgi:hypothetical protein